MAGTYSQYRCFAVLVFLLGFFALVSSASEAFDSNRHLGVEFEFKGRPFLITGEQIAQHTYVFNKGASQKISIVTLNWAPYIGETICKQGWVQQLTIALLGSRGYEITVRFLPWARAIRLAESGLVDMLYPEYFIEPTAPSDMYKGSNRLEHLALSRQLPGGPLVFMKRKGEADRYKGNLLNLRNEKIGVVRGYQNTPEFDALMDMGFFDTSESVDDVMNVRKLIANRNNLIIGDPAVIRFSISNAMVPQRERTRMLERIEVVLPEIQYNHLYFAISKKKSSWKTTLKVVNAAIEEFETSGLMSDIVKRVNTTCGYELGGVSVSR